jgi:Double-stranded RNA binding motif
MEHTRTPRKQLAAFLEGFGLHPSYRVTQSPQRDGMMQTWVIETYVRYGVGDSRVLGKGEGRTKRGANDQAANSALRNELSRLQILYGRQVQDKGFRAERRVLHAICDPLEPLPMWILGARIATKDEDSHGIDVVVATDCGPMWLQVKSSQSGKKKHEKKYPDAPIAVVVVQPDDTDNYVLGQIISGLRSLRTKRGLST